jgi:integrase
MGRPSRTGGVIAVGHDRIRFDFTIEGRRIRPIVRCVPTEENLAKARQRLAWIKQRIVEGTFRLGEEFPHYAVARGAHVPASAQSCSELFDAFLRHEDAQVLRGELAPATVEAHRQILNRHWRPHLGHLLYNDVTASQLQAIADTQGFSKKTYNNALGAIKSALAFGARDVRGRANPAALLKYAKTPKLSIDPFTLREAETLIAALHAEWSAGVAHFHELRFFTGLRPCEVIALRVADYERTHGVLAVTKTRVRGRERFKTKNGRDRRVVLCARAIDVLERQLGWRADLEARGLIEHDSLFCTDAGAPLRHAGEPGSRWMKTLARLPIRYRRPYVARHTSVSWRLMVGEPPLWVAEQHGHSILTMFTVYAAWTRGAQPKDVEAIRAALNRPRRPRAFGTGFGTGMPNAGAKTLKRKENTGGADGTRTGNACRSVTY